ncbi:MAG: dTDP-glucose 4,6-dehydratase [Bacteroidetes bacterium]|nr:dTDP-glucose 4,6-dehydratase [Bacteroidota bacterium]MCH8246080.1 dTDP-glucose 4,6-dehydratase [Bacteroidota bacterium]
MTFRPRSVLVTGGAGFIGSNYLHWMVSRHPEIRFVNLDLLTYAGNLANIESISAEANYEFVQGDITDSALVEMLFQTHGFDTVVHFAAESHVDRSIEDPLSFVRTNVIGTTILLETARTFWKASDSMSLCRFHHVSTDEVYGSLGTTGQFLESTPYAPRSPYAASKASSDHFVRAFAETYGLPILITNCSNNFGPYQFPEKLIPLTIVNAVSEQAIPVYGRGDNIRDWLFVLDHCEALELVLQRGTPGQTYLIGGGNEWSNLDLVNKILDRVDESLSRPEGTGRALVSFVDDRPGHDFRYSVNTDRIQAELDWRPSHSLDEALELTVTWYLENQDWIECVKDESYMRYYDRMYGDRISNKDDG